jgi:hypothetical protein
MPNPRFMARFEAKNLRLEIWINSIPAAFLAPGESAGVVSLPLNEFITPGKNRLGAMLHAGPLATRSAEPWANDPAAASYTGPASLRLRLGVYASGESVQGADPEPVLAAIDWEGAAEATPILMGREFEGVDAMGRWAWQDATPLDLSQAPVRAAAWEYLRRLHGMLAAGRFEEFLEESSIKIEEYARACGMAEGPVRRNMLQALQTETPRMQLRPLELDDTDLRLVASRRMIQCLRTDRHHALEFAGSGKETFFLPAMIGLTASGWRLLR